MIFEGPFELDYSVLCITKLLPQFWVWSAPLCQSLDSVSPLESGSQDLASQRITVSEKWRGHAVKFTEAPDYSYFKCLHRAGICLLTLHRTAQRTLSCSSGQQNVISQIWLSPFTSQSKKISNQGCSSGLDQASLTESHRWPAPQSPQDGTHSTVQKGPAA